MWLRIRQDIRQTMNFSGVIGTLETVSAVSMTPH
jgi:hypothetical protein